MSWSGDQTGYRILPAFTAPICGLPATPPHAGVPCTVGCDQDVMTSAPWLVVQTSAGKEVLVGPGFNHYFNYRVYI